MNLSTAASSSLRSPVRPWPASDEPRGVDDGGQVPLAEVALDEAAGGGADQQRARRAGVQLVHDEHVHAAFERLRVGLDVEGHRPRGGGSGRS